ncbi:LacI family transcriptional regulator [Novosphingobium sp. 1949]|uniref:LacI family transcriptional regulator n=1 Tax=Novosphingobium organovorum TaxID=2930092 RepID=A0ABT0BIZ9_9SPHN|nr:LacI family DNA-binding transcriptional regulator [Novosphingobium organovorum]MCJ2185019.1 LacI family transcriptional regulator [Novosphingobium organovorum]
MEKGRTNGRSGRRDGRRARAATSSDVARLAGVSRSAVSRTFTDGASVAPETRARVLEAAKTLKYRPNLAARSLMTRRSMIVALAVSHLENLFYPLIVQTISERLAAVGYRLLLFVTHGEGSHEPLVGELRHFSVDGLILGSSGYAPDLLAECAEEGLPVVLMNNAGAAPAAARVVGDNLAGGAQIARFLLAGGHQRMAYLAGDEGVSSTLERLEGFAGALHAAGMEGLRVVPAGFEFDRALAASRALLATPDRPDALFCANDHMAFAAIQAARTLGLKVGWDVSIVGFDDVAVAGWPDLALTTYAQPAPAFAQAVVDHLLGLIDGAAGGGPVYRVPGELIVRDTARRPARGITRQDDGSWRWHDAAALA